MKIIDMTKALKVVIPEPTLYTIEMSGETLENYNELILRNTKANGIPCEKSELNKCPKCGTIFMKCNSFCMTCGQRVRFVESDIVPL